MQAPKPSLTIILSGAVLALIIAGALTIAAVSLGHLKGAGSKQGTAPFADSLLASPTASPVIVGTEHPVLANPPPSPTTSAKNESQNPAPTPVPRPSALVEKDLEEQAPSEATRERSEQARGEAERKRAHVEDLYQRHLISEAAYKKGQAAYQREMTKYQDQIRKYRSTATETEPTNE